MHGKNIFYTYCIKIKNKKKLSEVFSTFRKLFPILPFARDMSLNLEKKISNGKQYKIFKT